jgi:inorganic pyrophosphatase
MYQKIQSYTDLPELILKQIAHFFQHYKDLETGKWVKLEGWVDIDAAKQEIINSITRYHNHHG